MDPKALVSSPAVQGQQGPTGSRGTEGPQGPRGDGGRAGPPGFTGNQVSCLLIVNIVTIMTITIIFYTNYDYNFYDHGHFYHPLYNHIDNDNNYDYSIAIIFTIVMIASLKTVENPGPGCDVVCLFLHRETQAKMDLLVPEVPQ